MSIIWNRFMYDSNLMPSLLRNIHVTVYYNIVSEIMIAPCDGSSDQLNILGKRKHVKMHSFNLWENMHEVGFSHQYLIHGLPILLETELAGSGLNWEIS